MKSDNENNPRLKQDKFERKDNENSSAGMIAGVIIVIIALVGIFIYYKYELAPTPVTSVVAPATITTAPTATSPRARQHNPAAHPNQATPAANQNNNGNNVPVTTNNY